MVIKANWVGPTGQAVIFIDKTVKSLQMLLQSDLDSVFLNFDKLFLTDFATEADEFVAFVMLSGQ